MIRYVQGVTDTWKVHRVNFETQLELSRLRFECSDPEIRIIAYKAIPVAALPA